MFGGGGGFDPRKLQQMMNQMGIEVTEIDAEEVVIRTPDEELVFTDAQVQRMDAQGQGTYQIVGEPESRPRSDAKADPTGENAGTVAGGDDDGAEDGDASEGDSSGGDGAGGGAGGAAIPDADVEIVAQRTGSSTEDARAALEAEDGDLAAAVARLE